MLHPQLGERGLTDSSVVTMMHGVRGFFRFAHINGLIAADPGAQKRRKRRERPRKSEGALGMAQSLCARQSAAV